MYFVPNDYLRYPVVAFFIMTDTENYAGVYRIKMRFVMVNCFTFLSDRVGFKGYFDFLI